jgi:3-oxoadipate enol-lactonase
MMSQATVSVADGVDLAYSVRGGDQPARVVLIHSLALDRSVWDGVAERLASQAAVLTYDCRGHGASSRVPGPYSVDLFADDLAALLDAVGWDTAVVAGASMGGSVAQAFATRYPERISGLGLMDTTAWYGADAAEHWEERAQQAEQKGLLSLIDFQLTRWFGDGFRQAHPEQVEHLKQVFLANDVGPYMAACRMLGSFDLRERIRHVHVPTAIVVGEEDYATPLAMARDIQARVRDSTYLELAGVRHLSIVEAVQPIVEVLRNLLRNVARVS